MNAIVTIFLLATLTLLPTARVALGADETDKPVARPEIRVGDRWSFRRIDKITNRTMYDYDSRVSFVGPNVIIVVTGVRGKEGVDDSHWTPEWNPMLVLGNVITPHGGWFKFPLAVGATHDIAYTAQRPNQEFKNERKTTVAGWEEISVPAGKFRALKLEIKGVWQSLTWRGGGTDMTTIWYVPEVKRWVRLDTESSWSSGHSSESHELLEYSLQK